MINYQGKLTTSAGAPVNDTLQMVFSIYADSGGTNLLWTETQPAVIVEKGVFNVLLGSVDSIPYSVFDGSIRYLGVKVGDDPEITPRKPMVSVAYAYRAGTGGGGGGWVDDGTVVRLEDSTDYVGIGTTEPSRRLTVQDTRSVTSGEHILATLRTGISNDDAELSFGYRANGTAVTSHLVRSTNSLPLTFGTTGTGQAMTITNNGNVGIGTTDPQRALHISDVLRLEPRASAPSNPSEGDIYVNSADHHIYCYLNGVWKQLD
jgi:hypothetical protein